ncbi:DUF3102 domain-containing protein [Enterococcus sp. SMC-9]|uniref:DUF3102 domain-containing protein n=1 Tax=Enterococcus sp. SMC-9 TaxID=2862343 RepID=UPI001E3E8D27|nr:DUF3102 domain-containing protein [Enterococcus sp. SMC-9]MCD1025793.1 DUF3102 domain-containing protein [Enterococcus sp. SMC-9]
MNELSLSSDINVITAEINSYKQIAGQSIWEIGRRLNYVKENDLAHGEFGEWLETVGINHPEANRMMKVAKEIPYSSTLTNLGTTALYLITTLPEEERTQEHVTSKGEIKTPDEMTVRELQELKKQLKAKDEQIATQAKMIDNLTEQEPEVVEKEVVIEKIPDDYHDLKSSNMALLRELNSVSGDYQKSSQLISDINAENEKLKAEQERLKRELNTKRQMENDELEQAQLKRLQRDADISVHKLILNMNEFVKEQAVTVYDSQAIAGASPDTKQKLDEGIKRVENLLKDIKQEIGGEVAWIIN